MHKAIAKLYIGVHCVVYIIHISQADLGEVVGTYVSTQYELSTTTTETERKRVCGEICMMYTKAGNK